MGVRKAINNFYDVLRSMMYLNSVNIPNELPFQGLVSHDAEMRGCLESH